MTEQDPNTPVESVSEEGALAELDNLRLEEELAETQAELAVTTLAAPGVANSYSITLDADAASNKEVLLAPTPSEPSKVSMLVQGGPVAENGVDFIVAENGILSWAGKEGLDPEEGDSVGLEEGDILVVSYFA